MKLRDIHANAWIGGVLMIVAVVFYRLAGSFFNPQAALWPRAVLIVMMILSVVLLIQGIRLTGQRADSMIPDAQAFRGSMASFVYIVAYAVLIHLLGYFAATAILLPAGMFLLGSRNWKAIIGVTIGMELFIWLLFVVGLKLRMP